MEQLRSHSLLQGTANVLSRHKGEGIYPAQDRTLLQGEVEAAMLQVCMLCRRRAKGPALSSSMSRVRGGGRSGEAWAQQHSSHLEQVDHVPSPQACASIRAVGTYLQLTHRIMSCTCCCCWNCWCAMPAGAAGQVPVH